MWEKCSATVKYKKYPNLFSVLMISVLSSYYSSLYATPVYGSVNSNTYSIYNHKNLTKIPTTATTLAAATSKRTTSSAPTTTTTTTSTTSSRSTLPAIVGVNSAASTSTPTSTASLQQIGVRSLLHIYDDCLHNKIGFVPCLKKKAISFIDHIYNINAISVTDGIKIVRLPAVEIAASRLSLVSDNDLESTLSRSTIDRDTKLTKILIERLSNYFNGHSLQVNFPKINVEEIGRSFSEGRGKMKKMMGAMMMGMAMKMVGMLPIALGSLYILAGKALIVSKIALLLAGMMGLKKLLSDGGGSSSSSGWSSSGGGGGGGGGWSSGGGGGGGGGGWDRRSYNEAHDLAYRNYNRQYIEQQAQQAKQPKHQKQQQQPVLTHSQKQQQYQLLH